MQYLKTLYSLRTCTRGANFIDIYHRSGLYPIELPFRPGMEGGGIVIETGSSVKHFSRGDRVIYKEVSIQKGEKLGHFAYSGSTVLLLSKKVNSAL